MRGCGKTTNNMVQVKKSGQMGLVFKDNFVMDSKMDQEHFYGRIRVNMSANFSTMIFMDRVPTPGKTNAPLLDHG